MARVDNPHTDDCWSRIGGQYSRVAESVGKCVFCDLRDKYLISENNKVVLTVNIFPYVEGHMLIIPRRHILRLSELHPDEWDAVKYFSLVGIDLIKRTYSIEDMIIIYREGGKLAGKSVGHLHFQIIPAVEGFLKQTDTGQFYEFQKIKLSPEKVAEKYRDDFAKMLL